MTDQEYLDALNALLLIVMFRGDTTFANILNMKIDKIIKETGLTPTV